MAVVNTEDDMYLTYGGLAGGAAHNRYVLTHSGEFLLQSWNSTSAAWMDLRRWASWACNRYGHCGPYGYCDNTVAAPTCRCLDGFEPADPEEWSGGSFSRGCRLTVALQCGDGFLALPGMKSPDNSGSSKGDVTRCLVRTQELDTEKIGDDGMRSN
ncbi:putative inactive G-type lectin S-receptor-like serine/threonine-protein kinase SRK [Panicum virgatum]|uniref:putative inactive G-type lectin S-receptor-like serine/threonine-protein kinase SRK n=1 Tax=Panicum virgatum TaxID=38727 RepID=UPI0019D5C86D|nr:putative inactive G-type lectin S-receptor-like serine/threonine-protein kinase SRK [Panicum virgatum]